MILQKFIAQSGYCSRRKAEELVKAGKVTVNGKIAESGAVVGHEDEVRIGAKRIRPSEENKIYIIMNKPPGYTCTKRKFEGEKNVFDLISNHLQKEREDNAGFKNDLHALNIAGRLDKESRGLVLLTNDGDLLYRLTHPKYGHEKEYLVKIYDFKFSPAKRAQVISKQFLNELIFKFENGVEIGDGDGIAKAKTVEYLGKGKFKVVLTGGKKRQIRRMFEAMSLKVEDLQRIRINDISLGDLKEGDWKYIKYNL